MTAFLCVGDLHLGAGTEYGREPGDRLRDQEAVWTRVLELAVEHDVDAVLFAGDAFHHRRPTPAQLIAFQRPLQAFRAAHDIEVLAINGNHDCEAAELPTALDVFGREVDLYTRPGVWQAPGGVAVACLPWAPVSRLVAARGGGDRDDLHREAAGLLLATARGLRAEIPSGQPAVLMTHYSISGAVTPTGRDVGPDFGVVLPVEELEAFGFDAIVAGHIHKAQRLDTPVDVGIETPIFFTGTPAPVDFGEADTAHGVWLLDLAQFGTSTGASPLFLPIESRPFLTFDCEVGKDASNGEIFEHLTGLGSVADAVVRVRYSATEEQARRIDHHEISKALYDAGVHKVFQIAATIERADRARVAGVDEDLAPLAAFDLYTAANELAPDLALRARGRLAEHLEAVGS